MSGLSDPMEAARRWCAGLYTPRRLAAALAASAALYLLLVNASWRITPDSALYLALGRSLAETHSYTFNFEPHRLVPPAYPALLAAADALGGGGFVGLRLLHAAMGWLCGLAAFLALRRLYGSDLAFAVYLLFAVSHTLFARSAYFLSDVPFALAVWLAILAAARAMGAPRGRWAAAVLAGAALGLPPLVRINGWGILPPVLLVLALRWRKDGAAGWGRLFAAAAAALAVPVAWSAWTAAAAPPDALTYHEAVLSQGANFLGWYARAMLGYVNETAVALLGFPDVPPGVDVAVLVPVAVGLAAMLRRRDLLLPGLVIVQYAGLAVSKPGERYLIPLLPALYLGGIIGLIIIVQWMQAQSARLRGRRAGRAAAAAMIVLAAIQVGRDGKSVWQARTAVPGGAEPAARQCWFEAARHIPRREDFGATPTVLTDQVGIVNFLAGARCLSTGTLSADGPLAARPAYVILDRDSKDWPAVRRTVVRMGWHLEPVATAPAVQPLVVARIVGGP